MNKQINVDIDNTLISNKTSSDEKSHKYFTGYLDHDFQMERVYN